MLDKVDPFGYMGRVSKLSRGPWFRTWDIEEDGLEHFYSFTYMGFQQYLLSNNVPIQDRERMQNLFRAIKRNNQMAWCAGLYLAFETSLRIPYLKSVALGWRVLSVFGIGFAYKLGFSYYNSHTYGPIAAAYLRKHFKLARGDMFEIKDEKREYFYIDTT